MLVGLHSVYRLPHTLLSKVITIRAHEGRMQTQRNEAGEGSDRSEWQVTR